MSENTETTRVGPGLVGIRGWLIFPAIGMTLSPILGAIWLFSSLDTLNKMVNYGFGLYAIPRYIVNLGILIYTIVAAVRFFKKRSNAPPTLIRLLIARIVASLVLFLVGVFVTGAGNLELIVALLRSNNFVASGIAAAIWIPYLRISQRVKATFLH